MKIVAGTDKGLIIYQQNCESWEIKDIAFIGLPIGAFHQDHSGRWWVAINHKHWGPKLYLSENQGENFKEVASPKFEGLEQSLKSIWTIKSQQVGPIERIFIGTEPAALFISEDLGSSFKELKALSEHPTRDSWQGGGKGIKSPFLHTIVFNPNDSNELMVGVSCAGIFKSKDLGNTWNPSNNGLKAFFLPNSEVEVGHDPHSILRHPIEPNVLWQQNHCGIFRSEDNGNYWKDVSDQSGIAQYGFDLVIDEEDTHTAWAIPAQSDDLRYPYKTQLAVYQTTDGGEHWHSKSIGLPKTASFDLVLRDGFDKKGDLMAFGTNNGNLYVSQDMSEKWQTITQNLSTIRSVNIL